MRLIPKSAGDLTGVKRTFAQTRYCLAQTKKWLDFQLAALVN